MIKLYQDPRKTATFSDNEDIYSAFIGQIFTNFDANCNNEQFYENMFHELTTMSENRAKVFAELKIMSVELSDVLQKTGALIHRIASLYEKSCKISATVFKKLNFEPDASLIAANETLVTGLREWGSELVSQKKFVMDHLTSFFHYKKHEDLELGSLLSYKQQVTQLYKKRWQILECKKTKLFDKKEVLNWEIDLDNLPADFSETKNDYQRIQGFMLPDVS